MDITPALAQGKKLITGYGPGGFRINHEEIKGSLLVLPERVEPWNVANTDALTLADFPPVLESSGVELLLIGTGTRMAHVDSSIRMALKQKNIAVEAMDTGAACRTYNVLLAEERKVAAALVAI